MRDEYWVTTFWVFVGQAHPRYRPAPRNPAPAFAINAVNEVVNLGGGLGLRYCLVAGAF